MSSGFLQIKSSEFKLAACLYETAKYLSIPVTHCHKQVVSHPRNLRNIFSVFFAPEHAACVFKKNTVSRHQIAAARPQFFRGAATQAAKENYLSFMDKLENLPAPEPVNKAIRR